MPGLDVGEPGELHRRVDGLRAGTGEEDACVGDRREFGDALGERVGRPVGERIEARVGRDRADLTADGVGDLRAAMPDLAVPEARHGIDHLVAVDIPQQRALASGDGDELLAGRLREGVEEGAWHGSQSCT